MRARARAGKFHLITHPYSASRGACDAAECRRRPHTDRPAHGSRAVNCSVLIRRRASVVFLREERTFLPPRGSGALAAPVPRALVLAVIPPLSPPPPLWRCECIGCIPPPAWLSLIRKNVAGHSRTLGEPRVENPPSSWQPPTPRSRRRPASTPVDPGTYPERRRLPLAAVIPSLMRLDVRGRGINNTPDSDGISDTFRPSASIYLPSCEFCIVYRLILVNFSKCKKREGRMRVSRCLSSCYICFNK